MIATTMNFCYTSCLLMILFTLCYTDDAKNRVKCDDHQYLEMGTSATINCSITKPFDGVYWYWYNQNCDANKTNYEFLEYKNNTKSGTLYSSGDFDVDPDGSLIINNVSLIHERFFKVVVRYGLDTPDDCVRVFVIAYPLNKDLLIDNCDLLHDRRCYIESGRTGKLTCRVKGIRPKVELEWILTSAAKSKVVSLEPQTQTIQINGETYNVYLDIAYHIPKPVTRISLTCKVARNDSFFNFSKQVTVLVKTDKEEVHIFPTYAIVIVVVLLLSVIIAVFVYCILHYRRGRGRRENPERYQQQMDEREIAPMMQEDELQLRKQKFVKELKEIYQNLCDRWPLLPSGIKGKVSIKNGYVENTLHKSNLPSQALTSHHDIFGKECSKRILLIGDHGMGKTTIALKAAYDWCERNLNSPLQYIDIFILIRLKDNRGATSIYQTIKQNILPNESELEEDDIQNIILSCSSLVIVFDGFDEYFAEYSSDILHIIKGTLFPEATVLTTAKPSLLPEITETEITNIYIKGFNESARSDYTSKYYEKGEDETFGADNVYFQYLSNVPLFFTLLTYMKHNSLDQKPINSVTRLFDSFMGMEGEKKQLDSNSIDIFNNDLYAKAFESLKSSHGQISLLVDDFVKNITEHFYNRYVTIGVFEDYNYSQSSNEIDYNGKSPGGINFTHRLFQEWFAAHHLVKLLKDTPEGVENHSLKEIKPRKQPYLLRFASGLSKTAASRIIEHVIKDEDCLSLAILCAFEKDGNCKHMDNAIRKLCSKTLKFQKGDSELLQHSTTELLKYASQNMITVSALEFRSSLQIFLEISKMNSEHGETPLRTVRHLTLHESKRELSTNEVVTTIKISSCCQDLERLSFISRFKPKSIEKEDTFCKLKDPKPKVSWTKKPNIHFILNPDTGRWEVPAPPLQTPITPDEVEQSSVWTP